MIPYGRQYIDEEDIKAVIDVLRSDWLTTGPNVVKFEKYFSKYTGALYSVAVASGTAALHCAMYAIDIRPGDEVVVPPITFVATANCVCYQGGTPVFADVDQDTALIDPEAVEKKITSRTKAIIGVDYAGQPCDWNRLRDIADKYGLILIADSSHALGAELNGKKVGTIADLSTFSFHPVKHITTGEGGMVTTDNVTWADRIKRFRNHGIDTDHHQRQKLASWYYEMQDLGYNYRICDIQCALGCSQLKKIDGFVSRRREIAKKYDGFFLKMKYAKPLGVHRDVKHAYHLYPIKVDFEALGADRESIFSTLREKGIGINVHYIPVHYHPFYLKNYNTFKGMCPVSELMYEQLISLPIYPKLKDSELNLIFEILESVLK